MNVCSGEAAVRRSRSLGISCVDGSCIASVFAMATVCQYSRVSGLFARRLPLAFPLIAASGDCRAVDEFRGRGSNRLSDLDGHAVRRSVLALG